MFSGRYSRKFGSAFGIVATTGSVVSHSGSSRVFASKEFLNSNLLKSILDEIQVWEVKPFDVGSFWNNQSSKPGMNVEVLKSKKLLTLAKLMKFADLNTGEEFQKDEKKRQKALALKKDVETVMMGNMEDKIKEFFRGDFFKSRCKNMLNQTLQYGEGISIDTDSGELVGNPRYVNSFFRFLRSNYEDVSEVLTASTYKEVLCNKKGEYDAEVFVKRFAALDSAYRIFIADLGWYEKSGFSEIYFLAKAFNNTKYILTGELDISQQDVQFLKDHFVALIRYSKNFIKDGFLTSGDVLKAIRLIGEKLEGNCRGCKLVLQKIKNFEGNGFGFSKDTSSKVLYAMSENWALINKLVNDQDDAIPVFDRNGINSTFLCNDSNSGEYLWARFDELLESLLSPISLQNKKDES